jgi:Ca2+-binding RTX toxin-like protein
MTTVDVTGKYVIHGNQTLTFTDETGFYIDQIDNTPPSLINLGTVNVVGTQDGGGIAGIENGASWFYGGLIWNKAGATFTVTATGADASATGYDTGSWGEKVLNDGLFQVTATGTAAGEVSWDPDAGFTNNGDFVIAGGQGATGVDLVNGGYFINTGDFIVRGGSGGATGVIFGDFELSFDNSGKIIATDSTADIDSVAVTLSPQDGVPVINSGVIKGDYAIREGYYESNTTLDNSGKLIGKVDLAFGDDTIHNTGKIIGDVTMGEGADTFDGAGGKVHGAVYGGLGDDVLTGGKGGDILFGDGAAESGQDGDDLLSGGGGNDQLHGLDGADTLIGGAGADTLSGGFGKDVFVYSALSDSAVGHADLITDLANSDRIDLSAIDADTTEAGDQAFTLVSALDGHAGEAALSYDAASGLTSLSLDVDGDGVADAVVTISGEHQDFTGLLL